MRLPLLLAATAVLASATIQEPAEGPQIPNKRRQKALAEELYSHVLHTPEGMRAADAVLTELDRVVLTKTSALKSWRKSLLKHASKGREIEKKSGRAFWWEEEKRGFYIVGGETKKPKGLLIGFHGGGVGSGDANSSHGQMSNAAKELDWLGIFPQVLEKTERGWTDSGTEEWVLELMDAALRTWEIDPAHVYFSGHSMGGYASWTLGGHHADRLAGAAPAAGAPTPVYGPEGTIIEIDSGVVPNLRNLPFKAYQSIDDPRVPPDANQAAVKDIDKARERWGGYEDFEYWEVDGRGHGLPPGGMLALMEKIAPYRRNPVPEKIVWQPRLEWKRQFYWLWWEKPELERIVVATLDREANAVDVASRADLSGLWVLLDDRVLDLEREIVVRVNGVESWRGTAERTLGTMARTALDGDPERIFEARVPVSP
jgi:poly(3-hydroxybutyrate) depolymerase